MWQLVARHLSNEATEEENSTLKKIMEEDPCLQFSMEVLSNFLEGDNNKAAEEKSSGSHIQRMQQKENAIK